MPWFDGARRNCTQRALCQDAYRSGTILGQRDQRLQRVVQFVGVAHVGPCVVLNLRDRRRIELADFFEHRLRQHAPHLDRPRAPFLERSVVEVRVRIRVQNLVRRTATAPACRPRCSGCCRPRFPKAGAAGRRCPWPRSARPSSPRGRADDRESGCRLRCSPGTPRRRGTPRPADRPSACAESAAGPSCRSESAAAPARATASQRQRVLKIGDASAACSRIGCTVSACRNWKTSASGKLCCSASAMLSPLSVAAACNSKLNDAAEALAQRQSPGLVDASAEGRVNDELHAAAFVEEALGDDRLLRRHGAQHGAALQDVFDRLLGAGIVQAALVLEPTHGRAATFGLCGVMPTAGVSPSRSLTCWRKLATCCDSSAVRAGASPRQKGTLGGAPCASSHQHAARAHFHAPDPPRRVAQQHDVARCSRRRSPHRPCRRRCLPVRPRR